MSLNELNANLFMRLAEFVVWAEGHPEFAAIDPEFASLRERSAAALIIPGKASECVARPLKRLVRNHRRIAARRKHS